MNYEVVSYGGWEHCHRLSDETIELIITGDVGPRIIHFSFIDGDNVLKQFEADAGRTGGDTYRFYGGHRLWHAPESIPRTYQRDNMPVEHFELNDVHYFVPSVEFETGIQKQMSVTIQNGTVMIDHALTNMGMWTVELAPWAITQLKEGGVGILPLPPRAPHDGNLLPTHALTLWSYTMLNDERLTFGDKYILVQQSPDIADPLKLGLRVVRDLQWSVGWMGYLNNNTLFVKSHTPDTTPLTQYPDLDSQVEIFTDDAILELETMGQLVSLGQEETVKHREYWSLHADVELPETDEDIGQEITPLVREAHPHVGRRSVD